MTPRQRLVGCAVAFAVLSAPGFAGMLADALVGPTPPITTRVPARGEVAPAPVWHEVHAAPTHAARSRSPRATGRALDAAAWASTVKARAVAACESGGDIHAVSRSGTYRGKWQASPDFWRTYGGLRFAPRPELATEAEQDAVAYQGWLARGWQPWTCAR